MKVRVDDERCVGHGRCYALAPDVFAPDDFGHCVVLLPDVAAGTPEAERAEAGASNCPEDAITVEV